MASEGKVIAGALVGFTLGWFLFKTKDNIINCGQGCWDPMLQRCLTAEECAGIPSCADDLVAYQQLCASGYAQAMPWYHNTLRLGDRLG
jgi:hypothetical protein